MGLNIPLQGSLFGLPMAMRQANHCCIYLRVHLTIYMQFAWFGCGERSTNLENEKGVHGLYVTNREAAIETVTELLRRLPTSNAVNARQVADKFRRLFNLFHDEEHTKIKSFFNLGRAVLRPPYNRRLSASSEDEDDEDTLSDVHGSSDESSDQEPPKQPDQKRPSLDPPPSPRRKKSK